MSVRLIMVLSENWTVVSPRDLRALVRLAQEAEDCGIDGVMLSEHIVLGPSAGSAGRPLNPKDYAAPGNQDPGTPWPDSLVLMSAIAAATTRLRVIGAAIIAPLRHHPRGALLDEHLAAWELLWRETPATYEGEHYRFQDVYLEPKPFRRPLRERLSPGRGFDELEVVGGIRPRFTDWRSPADLVAAASSIPEQLASGYTSICFNPSQYVADVAEIPSACRRLLKLTDGQSACRVDPSGKRHPGAAGSSIAASGPQVPLA